MSLFYSLGRKLEWCHRLHYLASIIDGAKGSINYIHQKKSKYQGPYNHFLQKTDESGVQE